MRSRRKVIFTLHRVVPADEMSECYNPYLAISPESFDHLLRWLRSRGSVVSLDELLDAEHLKKNSTACAITFDDGWEDNHRIAFPILQAHSVPAMIYLVTGLIGKSELFPEERLWQLMRTATPHVRSQIIAKLPKGAEQNFLAAFKELPHAGKLAFLDDLQAVSSSPVAKFMDWQQVASMHRAGHSFGSHTMSHVILPLEEDAIVAAELADSKRELDFRLGQSTEHFAFPSGLFDERCIEAVRHAGYQTSVTTSIGTVESGYNPFLIHRLPMDNTVVNDVNGTFSSARSHYSVVRGMVGRAIAEEYMVPSVQAEDSIRPLKVLLIIDEMEAVTAGGTERQVLQIAQLLVGAGFDVQFAVLRRTQWLDNHSLPYPVKRFEIDKVKSLRGLAQLVALGRWMKQEHFDVVQSFFVEANVVIPILAWIAGVPVALGSRRNLNYWMNPFWRSLQRISNHFVTRLVANSEAVKRVVQETEQISPDKIDVMYNGLDIERFARNPELREKARGEFGYQNSDVVIGAVSVLRPIKGCETFIDAAHEVVRQSPQARFVLVGDGPLRRELETRASGLGDRFRFVGAQHDIRPFLNMFDIGVLASESEGFSNSILEYMAAGLPSVVSDVGGNLEAVGNAGLVVSSKNPKALAEALLQLVHDGEIRASLSREAILRAKRFSLDSTQVALVAYYRRLFHGTHRNP